MGSEIVRLGELLEVLTDYHANGAYVKLKENVELLDKPNYAAMIRTTNFEQNNFDTSLKYIDEHAYDFLKKSKVYAGDLIMNKIANAGSCYLMPELGMPVSLAMNLFLLRVNQKKANPSYVYLYLKLNEAYVKNFANGSVTKTITKDAVRNLEIVLPARKIQDDIVATYSAYTGKIQLNRQTNQTLEQMAKALFKSWFVDFDPVIDNALAAGNPIPPELEQKAQVRAAAQASQAKPGAHPHDHASELPQHLRELFPSEFEHTEALGWMPKGWGVGSLSDIADYEKEKTNTAELNLENYVSTENMNKEKSGISTAAKLASTDQVPIFSVGQTLISNIRPYFKKIWFASFNGGRSNDVLCFQAKYKDVNEYLYSLLYQDTFFEYMTVTSKGTKMPRGDKKAIMDWPVVLPTLNLMEEFSKIIKPSFLANQLRITESSTLIQMRDTLLPKLISGELRLPVAETDAPSLTDEASV